MDVGWDHEQRWWITTLNSRRLSILKQRIVKLALDFQVPLTYNGNIKCARGEISCQVCCLYGDRTHSKRQLTTVKVHCWRDVDPHSVVWVVLERNLKFQVNALFSPFLWVTIYFGQSQSDRCIVHVRVRGELKNFRRARDRWRLDVCIDFFSLNCFIPQSKF
jgi:hypothetical protein